MEQYGTTYKILIVAENGINHLKSNSKDYD